MSGTPSIKVEVDRELCCGYGLCAQICPEIFKLDEGGIAYVEDEIVPPGMEQEARDGAESCPAEAIKVIEL